MSTESQTSPITELARDVVYWRRKKLSIVVLLVATATWTALEVYEFNFVTVASWLAMFVVSSLFVWGNILRLFKKVSPEMSGVEISEESTVEMARTVRSWMEGGIRWMFRVGAEGNNFLFAGTVAALWVLSKLARFFDFVTFLYLGILGATTVPVIYNKYEDRINGWWEKLRMQCRKLYSMVDEKVFGKIENRVAGEKKVE
ncbi:hypothetical protein NMG60_11026104 [Bertholletia excelsa]